MTEKKSAATQKYLKLCFALAFGAALALLPTVGRRGMAEGLALCYETMIPALFPFLFLSDYLCSACFEAFGGRGGRFAAIAASLFGGFASGAAAINRLVVSGAVTREDGARLLCSLSNAGPAFTVCAVGLQMFGSARIGFMLLLSLYLSSVAVYFIFGCHRVKVGIVKAPPRASIPCSVGVAVRSTASLCGSVLLFSCLMSYARQTGLCGLPLTILHCAVEVSGGCLAAANGGYLYIAAGAISLLSASVLMQLRLVLAKSGVSLLPLLLSRLVHLPLTLIFLRLLLALTAGAESAFAALSDPRMFSLSPLFSLLLFLTAAAALLQSSRQ